MNRHAPSSLVDRLSDTLDAPNLSLDAVRNVAHVGRDLLHAQEDVKRVLPVGHPLVDQLRGEVAA